MRDGPRDSPSRAHRPGAIKGDVTHGPCGENRPSPTLLPSGLFSEGGILPSRYDPALEWERAQRRRAKEERQREAERRRQERERQREHMAERQTEANAQNAEVAERLEEIEALITCTLKRDLAVTFQSLKRPLQQPEFEP